LSGVDSLSASRRLFLRSRLCRAALWLLAFCFALNGAIAQPLPMMAHAAAPACAHHAQQRAPAANAAGHAQGCCKSSACACASATVLAEAAPARFAVVAPAAREAASAPPAAFACRAVPPPLRPPIA